MKPSDDEKTLVRAREDYARCRDHWDDNQKDAKDDLRFARLGEQWPTQIRQQRELEHRPVLTFNKMPAFIRQVVNDARQNKPAIKVHPQDSDSDPEVAEIIAGLIRNIETTSDADVAYDTAIEHAVGQGFGFWRINTRYTCDDTFDQDIVVERVANPFTVYGDPRSTAADSSDWNVAFIVTSMSKAEFEREYPDAEKTDWEHDFRDCGDWIDGDDVIVAEYWTRTKVKKEVVQLSDGKVVATAELEANPDAFEGLTVVGMPREVDSYEVTQRLCTGAEVLKTVKWAGKYIPIVPVYGDEVFDEDGKRHLRSLIRDAKDPQRMLNYWRSTTTELTALAPKAPWVGEEGAFDVDPNWSIANTATLSKLEYAQGKPMPQRQPFAGVPAGALQEALNAADDMKSIIGIYDASLGARSNETSGRAIMARQREGDVSTFHFIDNLQRAIRHGGRIIMDLIPKVYSTQRIIRTLGEDMQPETHEIAPNGQPVQPKLGEVPPEAMQAAMAQGMPPPEPPVIGKIYDLTLGKYDLTVTSGPAFSTRREELREMMMNALNGAPPEVGAVLLPRIAKLMDLPDAEDIADELKAILSPQQQQGIPPELQQQMQQGMQRIQQLEQENQSLKGQLANKQGELSIKARATEIHGFEAQTHRLQAMKPTFVRPQPGQP